LQQHVTYMLRNPSEYFFINPTSGDLILVKPLTADPQRRSEYTVSTALFISDVQSVFFI